MKPRTTLAASVAAAALAIPASPAQASDLLDAFDHHRIVALGQVHDLRQQDQFVLRLVRHPRFARTVDSVVVEFGNARFQARVDRYVAGGRMRASALKPLWRDLVATGGAMHDGPAKFFATVRRLNRTLPARRRVRVALGDPAFDWRRLRRASQFHRAVDRRDRVFAAAAEREARGRQHVLLLSGYMHFVRGVPLRHSGRTAVQILERRAPGRDWTVLPYAGASTQPEGFERRFIAPWRQIAIRPLTGELGGLPAARLLPPLATAAAIPTRASRCATSPTS